MKSYIVLYNPLAGNGRGKTAAYSLRTLLADGAVDFIDMTSITDYRSFFEHLSDETVPVIAGGDGTLNRFINETDGLTLPAEILYYAIGSGNDFLHDLGKKAGDAPCSIREYMQNLPIAEINGKRYRFLNGIGYGIDGYCCEVGDKLRAASPGKPIHYSLIALRGLLFEYTPTTATVTVDGAVFRYEKVWLAPTMHGRFYGGGFMPTPEQKRNNSEGTVSSMIACGRSRLRLLLIFPSLFQGKHVSQKKIVHIHTGHTITVAFDRPTALQIDGETILNVTQYTVYGSQSVPLSATNIAEQHAV